MSRLSDRTIGNYINNEIGQIIREDVIDSIRRGDFDYELIDRDRDISHIPEDATQQQLDVEREEYITKTYEYFINDTDFVDDFINENYTELLDDVGSDGYSYDPLLRAIRTRMGSEYTDRDLARGFRTLREDGLTAFDDFIEEHLPSGGSEASSRSVSEASSRSVSGGSTETTDPLPVAKDEREELVSDPTILNNIEAYTTAAEDKANRDYAASFKTGAQVAHSSFMDKIIERVEERRAKSNIEFGLPLGKSTSSPSDVDSDPVSYRVFRVNR